MLYSYTAILLQYSTTPPLHDHTTARPHDRTIARPYDHTTIRLHYFTTILLYFSICVDIGAAFSEDLQVLSRHYKNTTAAQTDDAR